MWRSLHGNESLDQQCQRFDGYYWQWAWSGTEKGIVTYDTATAAANASRMYSQNINDLRVKPGHLANWWWNPEGHVGTVIGFDNGRVLVSHTSSKGDTVASFSNNVKISHADTIGLSFRGYSSTNGRNLERVGVLSWPKSEKPVENKKKARNRSNTMIGLYIGDGEGRYGDKGGKYWASFEPVSKTVTYLSPEDAKAVSETLGTSFGNFTYKGWEAYMSQAEIFIDARVDPPVRFSEGLKAARA